MPGHSANRETQLISKAGAILRKLTPPRIATLLLVREGIETQSEMAERLNRAPPTISNYIESLEDLPVSLVETQNLTIQQNLTTGQPARVTKLFQQSAVLRATTLRWICKRSHGVVTLPQNG